MKTCPSCGGTSHHAVGRCAFWTHPKTRHLTDCPGCEGSGSILMMTRDGRKRPTCLLCKGGGRASEAATDTPVVSEKPGLECLHLAARHSASATPASALDAIPAAGHRDELVCVDRRSGKVVSRTDLADLGPSYEMIFQFPEATRRQLLEGSWDTDEGAENRLHRAGSERISL